MIHIQSTLLVISAMLGTTASTFASQVVVTSAVNFNDNSNITVTPNLVTNGSLNHSSFLEPSYPPNSHNAIMPSGWSNLPGTSTDLYHSGTNFSNGGSANVAYLDSSDGGTFVNALEFGSTGEGFQQTISNLDIGFIYSLTFEQSASHRFGANDVWWLVSFGNQSIESDHMTTPDPGMPLGWSNQTVQFTATASTQVLSFEARSTTNQNTSVVIDNVALVVTTVPEPSSALFGALAVGLFMFRRKRHTSS